MGTFGGSYVKPFTTQLTPTPSSAMATQVFSPVALLSVFDFTTPVPYPFGQERTGWGVTDTAAATRQPGNPPCDVMRDPDQPRQGPSP